MTPSPDNNYDFIINPGQAPKKRFNIPFAGDSFIMRIVFMLGGAVVVMIILAVVVNTFFGDKTNIASVIALTQSEQEIARLGAQGKKASSQEIKNAAANTQLSLKTHQNKWLGFLSEYGKDLKQKDLDLKKDTATDNRLKTAEQTSTFDTTYNAIMRSQLEAYATALSDAYDGSPNQEQRQFLRAHYNDVKLLLEQWPSASLGLANY